MSVLQDILIINGVGGCGKDTFVDISEEDFYIERYSTIDKYKDIAIYQFNWDEKKDKKGRKLLSDLKRAAIEYNDQPLQDLKRFIKAKDIEHTRIPDASYFYTIMLRDIDEIEKIVQDKEIGHRVCTVLIQSDRVDNKLGNVGDDNVENYTYDYILENNGTLDFFRITIDTFWHDFDTEIEIEEN